MAAGFVDVHLGGDAGFFEHDVELGHAHAAVFVVVRDHHENRRAVLGDGHPVGVVAYVDGRGEARAERDFVVFVGRGVESFGAERRVQQGCATGAETHDADAIWIDADLFGAAAHEADGALAVLCGREPHAGFIKRAAGHGVLEHNRRYADRVEPCGDLRAFQVVGEDVVRTAGRDDDGGGGIE